MNMEDGYQLAIWQGRLTARIAGYTIIPNGSKIIGNSFFVLLISKTSTFTYEIKHLDPLTHTVSLSITSDSFFHTLHEKYSELEPTLHDFLWFLILNRQLLS
jgi:hypothetical protein